MRKNSLWIAPAGLAALVVGASASAHRWSADYSAVPIFENRVVQLQAKINRLAREDVISEREADRLRGQAAGLRALVGIKARGGLNTAERIEIDLRLSRLAREVARDARDGRERRDHTLPAADDGPRDRSNLQRAPVNGR